jgi:hypothetical protein
LYKFSASETPPITVSHVIQFPKNIGTNKQAMSTFLHEEMQKLSNTLNQNKLHDSLNYLILQLPLLPINENLQLFDEFQQHCTTTTMQSKLQLEFSTKLFYENHQNNHNNNQDYLSKLLQGFLQQSQSKREDRHQFSVIAMALNPFTFSHVRHMINHIIINNIPKNIPSNRAIDLLFLDTLKIHPTKPAYFTINDLHKPAHKTIDFVRPKTPDSNHTNSNTSLDTTSSSSSSHDHNSSEVQLLGKIEDFQHILNRVLYMEKSFLEKVSE